MAAEQFSAKRLVKVIRQSLPVQSFLFLFFVALSTGHCRELLFSVHPFANPTVIYQTFQPLVDYLSKQTGRAISIKIAPNYLAHIKALGNGEAELGFVGPSPYVKIQDNFGNIELLARFDMIDNSNDRVVLFCRANAPFTTIEDLRGKTFAFGDYQSFGSHFMPRWMLGSNGVPPSSLTAYAFVRSHDNVILSVLHGDFDAGGVRLDVYNRYRDRPLRILAGPVDISPHAIVCRSDLDSGLKKNLQKSLLSLADKHILQKINPQLEGFEPVTDSDFDQARKVMHHIEAR